MRNKKGRKIKTPLVSGKPIIFDFKVEDEIISYEWHCPNCEGKKFIISIDKSRIACVNPKCLSIMGLRLRDTADLNNVTWKV